MERGKPREWETQILVGEPNKEELRISYGIANAIDKCLSPRNRNRTWLIKYYYLFIDKGRCNVKEIGIKLKETRESMGISIDEAASDLKVKEIQIENIEQGNMDAFKDVFYLKYFIRDYSKYLGLDYEDMVDEFNEYLFDYTSKISIEDIKQAKNKDKKKKEEKRIMSPYTLEYKRKTIKLNVLIIVIAILLVLTLIIMFIVL